MNNGHGSGVRAREASQRERHASPRARSAGRMAQALGWFSIGLGAAELLAPRRLGDAIGIDGDANRRWLQAMGLREIGVGLGILGEPRPVRWMQLRLAGDALDAALLARCMGAETSDRNRVAGAIAAVAGVAALDAWTTAWLGATSGPAMGEFWRERAIEVRHSITVRAPQDVIYRFWRDLENLPSVFLHLESVESLGDGRSHWRVRAPAGLSMAWDAEIIEDRPGERIAWRSLPDAQVDTDGAVRFMPAPGDRGTEVHVLLRYRPPGGRAGALFARLFGESPEQQVRDDLRALKQIMELGEVVRSDSSIHRRPHPAQPPERHVAAALEGAR